MALDTYKFPDGYDVKVVRKEEILECIAKNITDPEVVMAVIKNCEIDAANYLREGRWAGIPYIGNIRIPKGKQKLKSTETQALIKEAKENLDSHKYILFRKNLGKHIGEQVKANRYFNYVVSKMVTKHTKYFRHLCDVKGELFAKVLLYTMNDLNIADGSL